MSAHADFDQRAIFASTQPSCLASPFASLHCDRPAFRRALLSPLHLALVPEQTEAQQPVALLFASPGIGGPKLLRLRGWDPANPIPWPAIHSVAESGVGSNDIEVDHFATLAEMLQPSFWGLDADTASASTWHWIDAVLRHEASVDPSAAPRTHLQVLSELWQVVVAEIGWVLGALPGPLRSLLERGNGDAPFWLASALAEQLASHPPDSNERAYLSQLVATAPLPLLRMAVVETTGAALLDTITAGRSLSDFLLDWLPVPRAVWRRVMRDARRIPDIEVDAFRLALEALATAPTRDWPRSTEEWRQLADLASDVLDASEVESPTRCELLRLLWQRDAQGDVADHRRLFGAARLIVRLEGEGGGQPRPSALASAVSRLRAAGRRIRRTRRVTHDAAPLVSHRDTCDGLTLEISHDLREIARHGRALGNCLSAPGVAADYLRGGTLLGVVSAQGSPIAMVSFEVGSVGSGFLSLALREVQGAHGRNIDAATQRAIARLLSRTALHAGAPGEPS